MSRIPLYDIHDVGQLHAVTGRAPIERFHDRALPQNLVDDQFLAISKCWQPRSSKHHEEPWLESFPRTAYHLVGPHKYLSPIQHVRIPF